MFGVEPICKVLTSHGLKIATSTYYAAKNRTPSPRSGEAASLPTAASRAASTLDDTIQQILHESGYTKNIRPSEAITRKEKQANTASYGYKGSLRDADFPAAGR